jgi:hypothetical protein
MCGLPNTIRRKRGPGGLVGANTFGETLAGVIPWSENAGAKPLYMFTRCSNHTYSNTMITDAMFDKNTVNISSIMTRGSCKDYINAVETKHSFSLHRR